MARASVPARFNCRRCDWKRVLTLHTRAISTSFFEKRTAVRAEKMRQRRVVRARLGNPSEREALQIPRSAFVWTRLRRISHSPACPRPFPFSFPRFPSPVRQGVRNIEIVRMEGQNRRALWELDLKALHFGGATKRKHLSFASAPDCLCLQLPRELL